MAYINITNFSPVRVAALQELAHELPEYCSIPANDGIGQRFYFDPFLLYDIEEALKDAIYAETCASIKKQLPKAYRDSLNLGYLRYEFDEDVVEYCIEFDDEFEDYAVVRIHLESTYYAAANVPAQILLQNMELDEVLDEPEMPGDCYISWGAWLKKTYYDNEDIWRQRVIRHLILNHLM